MTTMIVCRDQRQAKELQRQSAPSNSVVFTWPCLRTLLVRSPKVIVVCEGVELHRLIPGEDVTLHKVLQDRQKAWGAEAVMVRL